MRGLLASLAVAVFFVAVALVAAGFGAVGLAFIGLLLHRWFDLSQWQGTLVALAVAVGLSALVYKIAQAPTEPSAWVDDGELDEAPEIEESPVVPWRRSRPTPGELPPSRSSGKRKPGGTAK